MRIRTPGCPSSGAPGLQEAEGARPGHMGTRCPPPLPPGARCTGSTLGTDASRGLPEQLPRCRCVIPGCSQGRGVPGRCGHGLPPPLCLGLPQQVEGRPLRGCCEHRAPAPQTVFEARGHRAGPGHTPALLSGPRDIVQARPVCVTRGGGGTWGLRVHPTPSHAPHASPQPAPKPISGAPLPRGVSSAPPEPAPGLSASRTALGRGAKVPWKPAHCLGCPRGPPRLAPGPQAQAVHGAPSDPRPPACPPAILPSLSQRSAPVLPQPPAPIPGLQSLPLPRLQPGGSPPTWGTDTRPRDAPGGGPRA